MLTRSCFEALAELITDSHANMTHRHKAGDHRPFDQVLGADLDGGEATVAFRMRLQILRNSAKHARAMPNGARASLIVQIDEIADVCQVELAWENRAEWQQAFEAAASGPVESDGGAA